MGKVDGYYSTEQQQEFIEKINPKDENFFKYIPNEFLSQEQLEAKKRALSKEAAKYGREAETFSQDRVDLPDPSEILSDLFKDEKAYAGSREHAESLQKYKDLQDRVKRAQRRIEDLDKQIAELCHIYIYTFKNAESARCFYKPLRLCVLI